MVEKVTERDRIFEGIGLWNDHNPSFRIRDELVGQNIFSPFPSVDVQCYGVDHDGELVAFAAVKRLEDPVPGFEEDDAAWLSLFAFETESPVAESLSSELLTTVLDEVAATGHSAVHFGCSPQNFLAGIPSTLHPSYSSALRCAGFEERQTVYDLERDITSFDDPAGVTDVENSWESLRVESAADAVDDLQSFLADQFPGRWHYEARNVCRYPGGGADYWILRNGDDVIGFARTNRHDGAYRGPNVNWGWRLANRYCGIGPLGVHKDYRGHRLGLYMITEIIREMKSRGYEHAVIDWTDIPGYYEQLGFDRWIEYQNVTHSV